MNPARRRWLARLAGLAAGGSSCGARAAELPAPAPGGPDGPVRRGRALQFPRDHGAHPASRIEWWYATGWVVAVPVEQASAGATDGWPVTAPEDARLIGFQVTFFRIRTGLGDGLAGRFVPRQLLFAHAAISEIGAGRHRHAERLARWSGADDTHLRARALRADADIAVGGWSLRRDEAADASHGPRVAWHTAIDGGDFGFDLALRRTQPVLLQGDAGFSRKGPQEAQASHYLSEPHLRVQGRLRLEAAAGLYPTPAGQPKAVPSGHAVRGRAWLDQEWSDELLHPDAVGWDWIGINLFDGGALTAFQLRRADGSALWVGGSFRPGLAPQPPSAPGAAARQAGAADASPRAFGPDEVRFIPGRRWRSPASDAGYPVEWEIHTPAGRFSVQALLDAQEIGGRTATGTIYWEGLSALVDARGHRVGLGYLEMTGYAGRLRLPG